MVRRQRLLTKKSRHIHQAAMLAPPPVVGFILYLLLPAAEASLHIWQISVPLHVVAGGDAVLECQWREDGAEVNGEGLYSLKWYHGLHEFYRWTAAERSPMQVFPIPESVFMVDRTRSTQGRVVVHSVQLGAGEAPLRCEISGEAPSFQTDTRWAKMSVVALPPGPPSLRGAAPLYPLDAPARLTCSAPPSKPHPALSFTINRGKVHTSYLEEPVVTHDHSSGLSTVSQTIQFPAALSLAPSGVIVVRCSASLPDLYWKSVEISLRVDVPEELRTRTQEYHFFGGASSSRPSLAALTVAAALAPTLHLLMS